MEAHGTSGMQIEYHQEEDSRFDSVVLDPVSTGVAWLRGCWGDGRGWV